jgi:hypothetical protein
MYMPAAAVFEYLNRFDNINGITEKYQTDIIIEQTLREIVKSTNDKEYEMYALGNISYKSLDPYMTKGKWITSKNDDYVPCVTYDDHKIGDMISLSIDGIAFEFKVCGIVDRKANILKFYTASNSPTLECMFENNGYNQSYPLIIFNQADISREFDFFPDLNGLLFFQTNDENKKIEIIDEINNYAWLKPMKEARLKSMDQFYIHVKTLMPIIFAVFFVGLVSTFCLSVLNTIRHIKLFSIYYICGMDWESHIKTCMIYVFMQIAAACFIITIFFLWAVGSSMLTLDLMIFGESNIYITILIFAMIVITSLASQIFIGKRETPVKYLKENC